MNFREDVMEKLRMKYKESSVQICRRACKYFYKYWLKSDDNVFNPEPFIKKRTSFYNFLNKNENKKLCCSYLALLSSVLQAYGADINKLRKIEYMRRRWVYENKHNSIEKASLKDNIDDLDMKSLLLKLKNNSIFGETDHLRYILVKLLSECPHRLTEISNLEYKCNKQKDNNYIDFKNNKIILNNHKNSNKSKQPKITNISNDLANEILFFKQKHGSKKWIFQQKKNHDNHRSSVQLSHLLNNTLGKNRGIRYLRKLNDTKKVKELDISKEKLIELIKQSDKMGHSIQTMILHYVKDLD